MAWKGSSVDPHGPYHQEQKQAFPAWLPAPHWFCSLWIELFRTTQSGECAHPFESRGRPMLTLVVPVWAALLLSARSH